MGVQVDSDNLTTYHFSGALRDLSFFLCVGGVNFFWGGQKKGRFDKGGNKVWPKYGKGEWGEELRIRPGGNTFFDNPNV